MTGAQTDTSTHRPRVAGEREREIFRATLAVLDDVGYDRLTMDAVAAEAKASKATLYRRWQGKADLVVDALTTLKKAAPAPDTGTLRGDLVAAFCGNHGLTEQEAASFASVVTALGRDREFAAVFRERVLGPKIAVSRQIYERARARGEIRPDLDLDLVSPALAGIVLHRRFVLGIEPSPTTTEAVIDQIILPAVLANPSEA